MIQKQSHVVCRKSCGASVIRHGSVVASHLTRLHVCLVLCVLCLVSCVLCGRWTVSLAWATEGQPEAASNLEARGQGVESRVSSVESDGSSSSDASSVEADYRRAKGLYETGQYDAARPIFQSVLRRDPTNPWAALYMELLDQKTGRARSVEANESVRATQEAASPGSEDVGEREEGARRAKIKELESAMQAARRAGAHTEVMMLAQKLLLIDAGHAKARRWHEQAEAQLVRQRERQAHEALVRAREVSAQEARRRARDGGGKKASLSTETSADAQIEALVREARALQEAHRYEEAIARYDMALAIDPYDEEMQEGRDRVRGAELESEADRLKRQEAIEDRELLLDVQRKKMLPEFRYGISPPSQESSAPSPTSRKSPSSIGEALLQPVTMDLDNVALVDVLRFLSQTSGVNIIPSTTVVQEGRALTLQVGEMPFSDVLSYIAKTHQLAYRVEEDAIWLTTTAEAAQEPVETRVYFLNQGQGMFAKFEGGTATTEGLGNGRTISEITTIKDVLEEALPPASGAKLVLDERSGALIATNTPANLRVLEELLYAIDITPVQVLIEARFIEVTVEDLSELGIDWQLDSPLKLDKERGQAQTQIAGGSGTSFTDAARQSEGFNLTYQGVLSRPQFTAVLHALEETEQGKTLSAPKITTLNNQEATIEVVDEFIYPTRYEVTLVQFDVNGDGDFDDASETEFVNAPKDFITRNVGIILKVTPNVGHDGQSITLALVPEVSEHAGTFFTYSGGVSIPRFTTRSLSTSVVVKDGETVVLGGLIKEIRSNIKTKVPILGSIPVLGALFRKETETVERRNLLIFVTARVLEPLRSIAEGGVEGASWSSSDGAAF